MEMNHVLVVEDDKEIREGVEIYLKSQVYEVFRAADGGRTGSHRKVKTSIRDCGYWRCRGWTESLWW